MRQIKNERHTEATITISNMARVKIHFPDQSPLFSTKIPLRITDMNYGNHLGNDRLLAIAQEARVQWLQSIGCTELNIGGCGLIMADAMISYKNEGHYGDVLNIDVFSADITPLSFDLLFRVSTKRADQTLLIAEIKTGMVGFDYSGKKAAALPEAFKKQL